MQRQEHQTVNALLDKDYYLRMLDVDPEADNDALMRLEPEVQRATPLALASIAQSGADARFGVTGLEETCRRWLIKNQEYRCPLYGAVCAHLHAAILSEPTSAYENVLLPAALLGWLPALRDVYVRRYTLQHYGIVPDADPHTHQRYVQARDSFHADVERFQIDTPPIIVTDVVYLGHSNVAALRKQIRAHLKREWAKIEAADPTARLRRPRF